MTLLGSCGNKPGFHGAGKATKPPRIRLSCYATSTVGTTFTDPYRLGMHSYKGNKSEKNGIIYACKGGHIDLGHLRKGADWTAFFAKRTLEQLKRKKTTFSFKLYEPSKYFVEVTYPDNWEAIPDEKKDEINRDMSIRLGQYFAFIGCTWHEIVTWFGYRPFALYPEFPSAFSWEDTYSNLMGTHIAAISLRDTEREFDEAMTMTLARELNRLGAQPRSTAIRASKKMRGEWFSGEFLFLINIKGRNLDIGLGDGHITPWLVPSLDECPHAEPHDYPTPNLDFLADYGFSVKLEIELKEVERKKILKVVYPGYKKRPKRIEPALHFGAIMAHIERDAEKKFGRVGPGHSNSRIEFQSGGNATFNDANIEEPMIISRTGNYR